MSDWFGVLAVIGLGGGLLYAFEAFLRVLFFAGRGVYSLVARIQDSKVDREWKRQAERSRSLAPDRVV